MGSPKPSWSGETFGRHIRWCSVVAAALSGLAHGVESNDNGATTKTAATTTTAATPLPQPEPYQQRIVDWIRSGDGGFFHPSVVWKRLGDGDSGPYAMHTTVDIAKGEKLLVVPRSHTIDSGETYDECVTISRMLDELEKGNESFYAPYLNYLFEDTPGGTSTGLLPTSWSNEGKELLHSILGHGDKNLAPLSPQDFEHYNAFEACGQDFRREVFLNKAKDDVSDKGEKEAQHRQQVEDAYLFWLSRSWTDKMIPILDMYNHRNGASKNVESTTVHAGDDHIIAYALRDIRAGEQLQNTYSECMDDDCNWGGMKYIYSTQNVFHDYGFLELYPRRWTLFVENGDDVLAEIDQDLETGAKAFKWIFEKPPKETFDWVSDQLQRLSSMDAKIREEISNHRKTTTGQAHNNIEHEADSLLELYEGYVELFKMALKHKEDPVSVSREQFEEELHAQQEEADGFYEEF
ncbi:hypothetical protein ACHAWF_003353 [Thalassiosira exigua]